MYQKDCFAFKKMLTGSIRCSALNLIDCRNCKFYKTKENYEKNVLPLKIER